MAASEDKIRNVGPKTGAWLRQVGVYSIADLRRLGAVEAYLKVKRAGFRPSLNLLYALGGAIENCHWTQLSDLQKNNLLVEMDTAESANPIKTRWQKASDSSSINNTITSQDPSGEDSTDNTDSTSEATPYDDVGTNRFE